MQLASRRKDQHARECRQDKSTPDRLPVGSISARSPVGKRDRVVGSCTNIVYTDSRQPIPPSSAESSREPFMTPTIRLARWVRSYTATLRGACLRIMPPAFINGVRRARGRPYRWQESDARPMGLAWRVIVFLSVE